MFKSFRDRIGCDFFFFKINQVMVKLGCYPRGGRLLESFLKTLFGKKGAVALSFSDDRKRLADDRDEDGRQRADSDRNPQLFTRKLHNFSAI